MWGYAGRWIPISASVQDGLTQHKSRYAQDVSKSVGLSNAEACLLSSLIACLKPSGGIVARMWNLRAALLAFPNYTLWNTNFETYFWIQIFYYYQIIWNVHWNSEKVTPQKRVIKFRLILLYKFPYKAYIKQNEVVHACNPGYSEVILAIQKTEAGESLELRISGSDHQLAYHNKIK